MNDDPRPHHPRPLSPAPLASTCPRPCGLPRRLLIMLYDGLVVIALWILAGAIALPFIDEGTRAGTHAGFSLYLLLVGYGYFAWCWQHGGMTLGMRAWRVRLVSDTGEPMNAWRSAGRLLGAFVSALPCGAGFVWSLFDDHRRTWHDRWSHSRLVRS